MYQSLNVVLTARRFPDGGCSVNLAFPVSVQKFDHCAPGAGQRSPPAPKGGRLWNGTTGGNAASP